MKYNKLMISTPNIWRTILFLCVWIIFFGLFLEINIRNFSSPLLGSGDINLGYYFASIFNQILSFSPFPNFKATTDLVMFPFGTDIAYQAWNIEALYLVNLGYRFLGHGPYFQIYAALSYLLTYWGIYFVLRKEFGTFKASFIAISSTFFNFYCLFKYPQHMNLAIVHWLLIGICLDFILLRRVTERTSISSAMLLTRSLVLFITFGLDLSYVTGYALTIVLIGLVYSLVEGIGYAKNNKLTGALLSKQIICSLIRSFKKHKLLNCVLLVLHLIPLYFFLPLVAQLFIKFSHVPKFNSAPYWANPMRLFVPWFPFPGLGKTDFLVNFFHDSPEAVGAQAPGYTLIILCVVGMYLFIKQLKQGYFNCKSRYYIPFLVLIIMSIVYHPSNFGVFKIFPWFAQMRVAGRSTMLYSTLFAFFGLLFLDYLQEIKNNRLKKATITVLSILALIELASAYKAKYQNYTPFLPSPDFYTFYQTIKNTPGAAVFDWPFCIISGTGLGEDDFCPFFTRHGATFALAAFHQKKQLSFYSGRLLPTQLNPLYESGLQNLVNLQTEAKLDKSVSSSVSSSESSISTKFRKQKCFTNQEWAFFLEYLAANSYAGVTIYPELLELECAQDFTSHFGKPAVETNLPDVGKALFYPIKTLNELPENSPVMNKSPKLIKYYTLEKFNFLSDKYKENALKITGLELKPAENNFSLPWLNLFAKESTVEINIKNAATYRLSLTLSTLFPSQEIRLLLNNNLIQIIDMQEGIKSSIKIPINFTNGKNILSLVASNKLTSVQIITNYIKSSELKLFEWNSFHQYLRARKESLAQITEFNLTLDR